MAKVPIINRVGDEFSGAVQIASTVGTNARMR